MMNENEIARIAVDICYNIHRRYGPGIFENVYETIFCYELEKIPLPFERQKGVRLFHEGTDMGISFVPDIIIAKKVIIELKSVENLVEVHHKQILTYLRITGLKLGLLINFQVPLIRNGIFRIVNNL
jgi:GxxExxY protein